MLLSLTSNRLPFGSPETDVSCTFPELSSALTESAPSRSAAADWNLAAQLSYLLQQSNTVERHRKTSSMSVVAGGRSGVRVATRREAGCGHGAAGSTEASMSREVAKVHLWKGLSRTPGPPIRGNKLEFFLHYSQITVSRASAWRNCGSVPKSPLGSD